MIRLTDSPTENHRKLNRNTPKASYISMTKRAGIRLPGSRVGGVERDRDALARPCEPFHAMLQPRREKEQATSRWRKRNSQTGSHPGQIDSRSLVHRHGRAARVAEENLPALHGTRYLHIINGGDEAARMRVEHVEVARPVRIDPAAQAELVLLLAALWPEMIQESLNVLLHLMAEFHDRRVLQFEQVKRIMPAPIVGPPGRVAVVLHQPVGESFQSLIQVYRSVLAKVDPGREQWHHPDLNPWRAPGRGIGGTIWLRFRHGVIAFEGIGFRRSEEHTSELQSHSDL